jgi:hypothetical protein
MRNPIASLPQRILSLVSQSPGLSDRQIANHLLGNSAAQQPVNIAARGLMKKGRLIRRRREDGLIGNYLEGAAPAPMPMQERPRKSTASSGEDDLSEDRLKHHLREWFRANSWEAVVAWGHERGVDIDSGRDGKRWIVEVKGIGSRPEMRVNYFIGVLGETLQRMNDPASKYSIGLPDVQQFRRLWDRLPRLAKQRTQITALFVSASGQVAEVFE